MRRLFEIALVSVTFALTFVVIVMCTLAVIRLWNGAC